MRRVVYFSLVFAGLTIGGAEGWAATCEAGPLTCPTQMPVGGYCECTARGKTENGTVVAQPSPQRPGNSTAGGCGANPNAPGCHPAQ